VYRRPQVLFSLPNAGRWTLPAGWHTDCPRLASGQPPGVQLFSFLDPVEPRGGAPLVVTGSHRLLNDGRALRVQAVNRELGRTPFFRDLFLGRTPAPGQADPLPMGRVADVRLKVAELTGRPGDVWLIDLRVLHAAAPNASHRPRMMVTYRFLRADLMPQISAAFGWT
jgi:ectoine hydroxylase-related dioxygenase (phytanoyl-CoA dioxygenase family)